MEANMAGELLARSNISYIIQSEDMGAFGAGIALPTPFGTTILVAEEEKQRVVDILAGVIEDNSENKK
jgi:hypothetical protein